MGWNLAPIPELNGRNCEGHVQPSVPGTYAGSVCLLSYQAGDICMVGMAGIAGMGATLAINISIFHVVLDKLLSIVTAKRRKKTTHARRVSIVKTGVCISFNLVLTFVPSVA